MKKITSLIIIIIMLFVTVSQSDESVFAKSERSIKTNKVPKFYMQTDKKWKNTAYGSDTTIGKLGCGPTTLAMCLYSLGNKKVTPVTACKWAAKNGYKTTAPGRVKDGFFTKYAQKYDIKVTRLNKGNLKEKSKSYRKKINKKALNAVKEGNWVISLMTDGTWAKRGHFILWYDVNGKNALIRDPISKKPKRVKNKYKLLQKEAIRYFIVHVPDDED